MEPGQLLRKTGDVVS